ncbi:MAG: hypothetical protein IOC82_16500 [Aestuariivirga sp.]|uniref:hypothetical protein n=1 Tax=Aestuariivirga sp. TaxID=2650926 RepID=UPI0025C2432F|nr:hypothetical protein [Aestuariivirga sp.]MCA3562616.1 hypothetical protein [Aestuariivirga sp.]
MKLTNFQIVVSSLAAVASVGLAAYQTFAPREAAQPPVNVVVTVDPQKADAIVPDETIAKTGSPALKTETMDLAEGASFTAALKDGSDSRYAFATLFDAQDDTFLAINPPDTEINVLVLFKGDTAHQVTALEYTPPSGVNPASMAKAVDVMVLPEGELGASGRPVMSFGLPQSGEARTFAFPSGEAGKGLWLRVAGAPGVSKSYVGDFRILSEQVAP